LSSAYFILDGDGGGAEVPGQRVQRAFSRRSLRTVTCFLASGRTLIGFGAETPLPESGSDTGDGPRTDGPARRRPATQDRFGLKRRPVRCPSRRTKRWGAPLLSAHTPCGAGSAESGGAEGKPSLLGISSFSGFKPVRVGIARPAGQPRSTSLCRPGLTGGQRPDHRSGHNGQVETKNKGGGNPSRIHGDAVRKT